VFAASGSVALLADLVHNVGDALTAVPLGIAFVLRSHVAERRAGMEVVGAIFISACVAGVEAVSRLVHPSAPTHLLALALAGGIGYAGNFLAGRIRTSAGRRLASPALIADGEHARADAYVSLAVVASALVVALGAPIADPLIGLLITVVILRITHHSWQTIRGSGQHDHGDHDHRHHHQTTTAEPASAAPSARTRVGSAQYKPRSTAPQPAVRGSSLPTPGAKRPTRAA
jgi:cation diffusion facilitator family transporter